MSNTDFLRETEALLLPDGFVQGHIFVLQTEDGRYQIEVDGWDPVSFEAIEINQSQTTHAYPKPGQKRKLAADVLKLIFLKEQGLITRGRIFITCEELYTWLHKSESWLRAACKHYGIAIELHQQKSKQIRKKIRNIHTNSRRH